jgi:hypothetical protein
MSRLPRILTVLFVLSFVLSACGGVSTDPAGVVKDLINAAFTNKQFDKIADFACAAKKEQVDAMFNLVRELRGPNIDTAAAKQLADAITISLTDMEFTKTSESGDKAVVAMKGKITLKFDSEKINQANEAIKGEAMSLGWGQEEKSSDISQNVDLVKENGKWVICPAN